MSEIEERMERLELIVQNLEALVLEMLKASEPQPSVQGWLRGWSERLKEKR